jgi:hypothetical protein
MRQNNWNIDAKNFYHVDFLIFFLILFPRQDRLNFLKNFFFGNLVQNIINLHFSLKSMYTFFIKISSFKNETTILFGRLYQRPLLVLSHKVIWWLFWQFLTPICFLKKQKDVISCLWLWTLICYQIRHFLDTTKYAR